MNAKKQTLWIALSVLMVAMMILSACAPGRHPCPDSAPCRTADRPPRRNRPAPAVFSTVPWQASSKALRLQHLERLPTPTR